MAAADDMDEVVKEFLVESHSNLDQLDRDLIALEKDPRSHEILANVFRTIHTIKGSCGFLGYGRLESVAHVGENLLSRLRDGRLGLNTEMTSALLAMVDAVRKMLASIEESGGDGEEDYAALIARLNALQTSLVPESEVAPSVPSEPGDAAAKADRSGRRRARRASDEAPPAAPATSAEAPNLFDDPEGIGLDLGSERGSTLVERTVRVDVGLLDKLMNLAGELVLARNQILQFSISQHDAGFIATSQRLNLITTELQEGVMKTRMQPIGNIWSKFPRVVRDLALFCGKQIRIEMEGRDTELDKTIIEAIRDPLTHLVRNAVDHGIEAPEVRRAAGKPAEGRLFMRAFHEGGQVNIKISDDGGGIDPERVKQRALERGLVTAEQAGRLSERELLSLIFLPGFSTASKVTSLSGRGVGMDVVRTNVEKIGGAVDVQSLLGQGTIINIKIPLTLAIIPALIVTSGGERYAIPQVSLLELVRLDGEQACSGIEMIHGAPVYRLRGNLLPLVYLDRELAGGEADGGTPAPRRGGGETLNIVVLRADDRQFGLVVEGVSDTEEIVVKPLGQQLKGISVFAGATIMGDGRVSLILDVVGIAQRGHVVSAARDRALAEEAVTIDDGHAERQTLLVLASADGRRMAVSLSMVARLEEFPRDAVERAGRQHVVQYRGEILPLIHLADVLDGCPSPATDSNEPLRVVVYTEAGRSVGLVVDRILDIVEDTVTLQRGVSRRGVLGSAVIQHHVTELLDVPRIIRAVDATFFDNSAAA